MGVDCCVGGQAWRMGVGVGGGGLTVAGGCIVVLAIRVRRGAWKTEGILSGGVFDDHLWSVKVMMCPWLMMSWVEMRAVLCMSGTS